MESDYVIVGAGSAGCVLANRLSADSDLKVVLLEAGPKDNALSLKIPSAMAANLKGTKHNWAFQGEPEPHLGQRHLQHDRGKTLGGSSSINGMVYIRGHARDFDNWRQSGCDGWAFADVLPYFKRMENYGGGSDSYRGSGGPLHVTRPNPTDPITRAFLEAGEQAGYPVTEDISGFRQEGFGVFDRTTATGERWSTARAYLDPAKSRPNLTVMTACMVHRVVMDNRRATGVEGVDQYGQPVTFTARREVILCAGAVGTPHLLMLSGIGSADHLHEMGIPVVADRPGVGANLNDHPDFVLKFHCEKPVSVWPETRPLRRILAGLRWLVMRDGVGATNHFEAVGCVRSAAGVDYPDIQLCITPIAMNEGSWEPIPAHAFQIHVGLMRPESRGRITLRDADPLSPPRILVNYLSDPRDRNVMREGIRLVRELVRQRAFDDLCGAEIFPGKEAESDADLDACLEAAVNTQWHLSGTAKMGRDTDATAVVDPSGRVHGINALRIVDASIMPKVTNGNTNSPTIMIAEKLSDAIRGVPPLPRIDADIWQNPNWDTRQR